MSGHGGHSQGVSQHTKRKIWWTLPAVNSLPASQDPAIVYCHQRHSGPVSPYSSGHFGQGSRNQEQQGTFSEIHPLTVRAPTVTIIRREPSISFLTAALLRAYGRGLLKTSMIYSAQITRIMTLSSSPATSYCSIILL